MDSAVPFARPARRPAYNVHFHDLRGTFITRLAQAGCSSIQIAAVTGHSAKTINQISSEYYLGETNTIADSAMLKLQGCCSQIILPVVAENHVIDNVDS
jgi:integrase